MGASGSGSETRPLLVPPREKQQGHPPRGSSGRRQAEWPGPESAAHRGSPQTERCLSLTASPSLVSCAKGDDRTGDGEGLGHAPAATAAFS